MTAPRRRPWWVLAPVLIATVLLTGALPADQARELATRALPVLGLVATLTVVSEVCSAAGLFDAAAGLAARAARGRRWALWVLVVVLATASTAVLSLDTTAVLLTPVVVVLARRTGSPPLPFALAVLALANTASLVLPVSNLTNLLADHALRASDVGYVGLMAAPAITAIVVTVALLAVRDRHALTGRFVTPADRPVPDRPLLVVTGVVTGCLAVAFAAGVTPVVVGAGAAVALLLAARLRHRPLPVPARDLVPWRMLLVVLALFAAVEVAHVHGLGRWLGDVSGTGTDLGALLRLAGTTAGTSNAVNNLPAYLALEPAAGGDPIRLAAVLIGAGAGPLLTPWGSLATLLWWGRCRQLMLAVPARTIVTQGLLLAPPVVAAAVLALAVTA
ncbi:SLC13 family permease [Cellulomonas soli]|uniref:SLC13 family permease n=1 Tax=Cellulomonas soli TaxID=931535 RepID=UPI003F839FCB